MSSILLSYKFLNVRQTTIQYLLYEILLSINVQLLFSLMILMLEYEILDNRTNCCGFSQTYVHTRNKLRNEFMLPLLMVTQRK